MATNRFEAMGLEAVKRSLALGHMAGRKAEHAKVWIAEREAAIDGSLARESRMLTERAVQAAEKQAIYARRAYERSNIAIVVSVVAIIMTAFFALLDFLIR